jgi:hypothetical protein
VRPTVIHSRRDGSAHSEQFQSDQRVFQVQARVPLNPPAPAPHTVRKLENESLAIEPSAWRDLLRFALVAGLIVGRWASASHDEDRCSQ